MKKSVILTILFCLMSIALVFSTFAADFVCDPNPTADRYRVLGLDPSSTIIPAESDGSMKYSVDSLVPGSYSGTVEAGAAYILNGNPQPAVRYSNPVPFDLTVPDTAAGSSGWAIK